MKMFILPYWKSVDDNWMHIHLFLSEGGRTLWQVDDALKPAQIKATLKKNDLIAIGTPLKQNGIYFVEIDTVKTNLTEFFSWDEIDPVNGSEDCWRQLHVPVELSTCKVFQEIYWKSTALPEVESVYAFFSKV